jgi:RNA polymerase sigma-70 factor (ECF subfamily)
MMNSEECQLVTRACGGNPQAAADLVERHYRGIYAFLRRLAGHDADAADLTQKTFMRVWTALDRFAGRSSLSSWLHGIAYHVYLDWLRANHRQTTPPDEWWQNCPDPRAGPDAQLIRADLAAVVYAAVDHLDPDLRAPVHLHYYQGLTLDETAAAIGIAASTVKYRLRQAIDTLRKGLAERPGLTRQPIPSRLL